MLPALPRSPSLFVGPVLLAGLTLLPSPSGLGAQEAGSALRVLRLPASARAMGLGDAYMMNAEASDAVFYHPALVEGAEGFGVEVQSWSGEATSASASAAGAWFGGSVAVGLQTLQYGVPGAELAELPGSHDLLFAPGDEPASERVATVAVARELGGFRVGVSGKLLEQRVAGERDATGAVDLGLATDLGPLVAAVSVQNLGPELGLPSGDVALPRRWSVGVGAYGRPVGPLDVGVTGSLRYDEAWEELIAAGGLEVGYWPVRGRTFVGRVGVRSVPQGDASPVSLGFAFWGDDLVLEWAWQPFGGAVDEGTHRFGIGWR